MNQATDECLATGGTDERTKPPTCALIIENQKVLNRRRNKVSIPSYPFKNIHGLPNQRLSNQVTKVTNDPMDPPKMIDSSQQSSMLLG